MGMSFIPLSYYHALYYAILEYGIWYVLSLGLAIMVFVHAWLRDVASALAWAFITFAVPVIGFALYIVYYLCSWKNLCASRKEREAAKEILKKWKEE